MYSLFIYFNVGLNDILNEGTFIGFDGTKSTYNNWKRQTTQNEDCVRLTPDGMFIPITCNQKYPGYICERGVWLLIVATMMNTLSKYYSV